MSAGLNWPVTSTDEVFRWSALWLADEVALIDAFVDGIAFSWGVADLSIALLVGGVVRNVVSVEGVKFVGDVVRLSIA
jgi:hypothetical protein